MGTGVAADRTGLVEAVSRLIDVSDPRFTPEVARGLIALDFSDGDRARAHELAVRNQSGTISSAEHDELMDYVKVDDPLALWQSRARKFLKDRGIR